MSKKNLDFGKFLSPAAGKDKPVREGTSQLTHDVNEASIPTNDDRTLQLKNGSRHHARSAYVAWQFLDAASYKPNDDLAMIVRIAKEGEASIDSDRLNRLKDTYLNWFDESARMTQLIRDIINSSATETREGLVLVNPFNLQTQADRDVFSDIDSQSTAFLKRLFRGRLRPPDNTPP